ncbi:MAG: hypothetical protein LDL41_13330 [Coleofasciculus sp. S288]|nr:hypothetical protein [Coleofasciculus sp. S288]
MAQTLALTTATVKYTPGQPRETQYGLRINAVLTLPDGTETKLWGNPDDAALLALRKGQSVQLAKNQKGQWQLIEQEQSPQQLQNGAVQNQVGGQFQPRSDDEKRAIAARVTEDAKLLRYCFQQAKEQCGEFCETSEDLRAIATTLFLQAVKR